jgi:hypothetical protein
MKQVNYDDEPSENYKESHTQWMLKLDTGSARNAFLSYVPSS